MINDQIGSSKKLTFMRAFTLAEVLITLGIIGVVAAISIPTLIQSSQEKATVSQLKKAYSTLSQAFLLAVQENGTPDTWNIGDYGGSPQPYTNAKNIITTLAPYLKVTKTCDQFETGCHVSPSWFLNNTTQYDFVSARMYKAALSDGSYLTAYTLSSSCGLGYGTGNTLNQRSSRFYFGRGFDYAWYYWRCRRHFNSYIDTKLSR